MLNVVRIWILFSTWLVGAGWILSALHQLNRAGYGVAFALAGVAAVYWWSKNQPSAAKSLLTAWRKFPRRCKRPAPRLFVLLALMAFVSGLLYAPYNSDTGAYRFPRVLHWLGQEQWHWIHTADARMNVAGCGFEWLITPILLFTRTDRFVFLVNWLSYLQLPGLVFCCFRLLGMRLRVAWWWAWLLSSGWCYVLQSASVANDSLAIVYALAAVTFALKAREGGKTADFWLALLAAALLTGVKQTSIPLAGLWLLAAWPQRENALAAPKTSLALAAISLLVSCVPTTFFNLLHTGSWAGVPALQASYPDWPIQLPSPLWGIIGNTFCLPVQNLLPPFFPWSGAWNHIMDEFVATPFGTRFKAFEHFGAVSPGISECSAGLGLALVLMTLFSLGAVRAFASGPSQKCAPAQLTLRWGPWFLLILCMAKVGTIQNARQLATYYVFLFPLLLVSPAHGNLVRRRWWQILAPLCISSSAVLLLVNASRPLFPAVTITQHLADAHPQSKLCSALRDAYSATISFQNAEQQIQKKLPPQEPLVGYAAIRNGHLEPALWQPLGSRRIERILITDSPEQLRQEGIHFVVIENYPSPDCFDIGEWMKRYHARLIADVQYQDRASSSDQSHVYLMRLENK